MSQAAWVGVGVFAAVAILAFVWLTPPDWLKDPTATGLGVLGYLF